MHGAINLASIATSISMGTALLAGLFAISVALKSPNPAPAPRDPTVSILLGVGLVLVVLNLAAAALIALGGMAYVGVLKAALLLTAAFAVTGVLFGLSRSLRSARAIKPQSA